MSKNVAVILSGCGFLDGAEIRESVLTLLHLDQQKADVTIFAPNKEQHHVVNHTEANEENIKRNILSESARIARCKITDLKELNPKGFDCLIMPGGFGVAKNFCSFAFEGSSGTVDPKIKEIIIEFNNLKKPIGALCIAPALVAMCLGDKGVSLTIGNDEGTAQEIEKTGAKHINCEVNSFHIDELNKIVSTPAYMFDDAGLADINKGIEGCITNTLSLCD